MQLTRVHELLRLRLGIHVSYMALYRFVLDHGWLPQHGGTVRMAATKPGEVVEVDFGYLGRIAEPRDGPVTESMGLRRRAGVQPPHARDDYLQAGHRGGHRRVRGRLGFF